ncbi:ead/Ea22-like family protein [Klebsiella pneumoniae]|uniref:ead/Ea22-like family protein n=1 Tax=Klebsiella pneumoniae TaxID=573 RepID=UPI000DAE06B3|nr:ead/Ea22-like family protein [Klebsiella pneumoniae]MTF64240.1 ead/Ea22-like family protein [Klebsiella pneumoniae]MTF69930.1 ead/Ea22-like family protein [Klebsiella pneumoniae]MTF98097.1 ead/Ea22-like family protein [Klebsiella pneumoniae]MTG73620.1 ead/Ea22-like family protein [Klebsiella pneumoniae]RAG93766.1 ead/Ea22-like family protein [Klebsiella pneumoniae]
MTDITELAQSLKAAAEKATPGEWRRASTQFNGITATPFMLGRKEVMIAGVSEKRDAEFIALANPANILALVEALEKAQQRNGELETYSKTALEFREAARDENRHLKLELEIAEKRIAELESRTVKLPDLRQIVSGDRYVWSDGVYNYSQDVKVALAAAGIKVEAE